MSGARDAAERRACGIVRVAMIERWFGIDFSGNHLMWRPGARASNVWIADLRRERGRLRVHDVVRVQGLPGPEAPFDRLVNLLSRGDFLGAGIDAPFSLPHAFVAPLGGHAALLRLVGGRRVLDRPFVGGTEMARLAAGKPPPFSPLKPMRAADAYWASRGVNVRSPMWTGARPGAPMTAACLTLLHRCARPMWPWVSTGEGLLAEAFPAGQLKTWGLPHERYDGASATAVQHRQTILGALARRGVRFSDHDKTLLGSADALDAVLAAFAALAIRDGSVAPPTALTVASEGWVAVHP